MTIKLISGEFCSRCHMIAPLLKQYAEKNGLSFIQKDVNNATPEELDGASMLPIIYFGDDRVEFDDAFARVSA